MGKLLSWALTPWSISESGGWKLQPVITVEGQVPFYASSPSPYIDKLQELHDNPEYARGAFYTMIGQLKDAQEQSWVMGVKL